MLKELSVGYHASILPSLLFIINVIIPETIIVIVKVTGDKRLMLDSVSALDIINFRVRFKGKV